MVVPIKHEQWAAGQGVAQPPGKCPVEVGVFPHWLAIDGQQPAIPENAPVERRRPAAKRIKSAAAKGSPAGAALMLPPAHTCPSCHQVTPTNNPPRRRTHKHQDLFYVQLHGCRPCRSMLCATRHQALLVRCSCEDNKMPCLPGAAADAAAARAAGEPGQPAQQQLPGQDDKQQQVVGVVRHVLSAELLLYLDRVTQLLRGEASPA